MNVISVIMAVFAVAGALDLILGNKLGLGKEFERGMKTFGLLALSMIGMIVLAPVIAHFLSPVLNNKTFSKWIEPSIIVSTIFANDMGGASLAKEFATTEALGYYNGLVVGSMMGCTVSFTLPFVMNEVKEEQHKSLILGLMCGICTIPVGCIAAGLVAGLSFWTVTWDLLPLFVFSALLVVGLLKFPKASVKVFKAFGKVVQTIVIVGLAVGLIEFLIGKDLPYTAPIQEGVDIVFSVCAVLSGAFPLIFTLSKILDKPLKRLGKKIGVNETSALGFLSTLATSVTTFGEMEKMDDRGVLLNSAFAVSAAFTIADHLAFTLSFQSSYVLAVTVGKVVAGVLALLLAWFLYCRKEKKQLKVA